MTSTIPDFVKKYLWDVNEKDISTSSYKNFIIERILEYGDFNSISWLEDTYSREDIIEVLRTSNKLSRNTGNLYSLYYNVPKEELLCIRKPFIQKQNRF
jgi:hypothetical protein